jgi:hypothetical protein
VSTRTEKPAGGGGLSVTTLAIASASSIVAAYVIHTFWQGGAILGAGVTPVIVAIVSESLKRPTRAITAIREERRTRTTVARRSPAEAPVAPPPELERPDPFGIWEADQKRSGFQWVKGRPLKLAIVTGLLAFAVAAFVVTGADLVFGNGSDGGDRLKLVPGTQERKATEDRDTETTTQPTETTETVPEEQVPPAETAPPTVPPEEQVPPPTTPVPTTPGTQPAPAPTPEQPAPAPSG